MTITIEGAEQAPSWGVLEQAVRTCFRDKRWTAIRIARQDEQVDYRGLGVYDVIFSVPGHGERLTVRLEVR